MIFITQWIEKVKLQVDELCVISGFLHEVDGNCTLLCYCAASSGNFLPTLKPEDGTDNLSQNVVKKLPLLAA
jgi:hypothetical protein